MGDQTNIEWCDSTFNPFIGCTKVSPGCDNCYAEKLMDHRMHKVVWGASQERVRTSAANWRKPLAWNAAADAFMAAHGRRQRVFCASLADVFDNEVDPQWRFDLIRLIEQTPNLDWLLLTKRIGNAAAMLDEAVLAINHGRWNWRDNVFPNVWLGATIVNQADADRDIAKLLAVPAARRFLSMEPLLGPVNLSAAFLPCLNSSGVQMDPSTGAYECCAACDYTGIGPEMGLDWIIVGGESGPGARPMHPIWARDLRDQCAAAGVPFLFKQWGEWLPGGHYTTELAIKDSNPTESKYLCALWTGATWNFGRFGPDEIHFDAEPMYLVGKKASGRKLYGHTHDEFPEAV